MLSRILTIGEAQRELPKGLVLVPRLEEHGPNHVDAIARVLQRAPGGCPAYLNVWDGAGHRGFFKLGSDFSVNPAAVSLGGLETLLGPGRRSSPAPPTATGAASSLQLADPAVRPLRLLVRGIERLQQPL